MERRDGTASVESRSPGGRALVVAGLIALPLLAVFSLPAAAGAWLLEKGHGLTIITTSFTAGTAAFNENGELEPVPDYRKFELSLNAEYGFTPWLTGIFRAQAQSQFSDGWLDQPTTAASLGARLKVLKRGNWMFSTQLMAESGDYDAIGFGVGESGPGVDARLLVGYGFTVRDIPAYADLQVAYRFRSDDSPDEGRLDLTLGVKPRPKWEMTLQSFNTMSLEVPEGVASYRYHKLRAAALRRLDNGLALEFGTFTLFYGENAIQEYGFDVSLWRSF